MSKDLNKLNPIPQFSVLIVDDDYRIRNLLKRFLKKNDYTVISAHNADLAISYLQTFKFDIVVADVMMPGKDGFELTKIISDRFKVPVFLLTALTEMNNKLYGFNSGADDYLTKPFEPEELLVRMKAIIRRQMLNLKSPQNDSLNEEGFYLDLDKQILRVSGNNISLTSSEIALLCVFNKHKNKVLSRDEIVEELNSNNKSSVSGKKILNNRLIDLQITRLRKKIEPIPTRPVYLKTVRGFGYKLLLKKKIN